VLLAGKNGQTEPVEGLLGRYSSGGGVSDGTGYFPREIAGNGHCSEPSGRVASPSYEQITFPAFLSGTVGNFPRDRPAKYSESG